MVIAGIKKSTGTYSARVIRLRSDTVTLPTIIVVEKSGDARDVLLVIPTLGSRAGFLRETLESIRAQDVDVDAVLVTPASAHEARDIARSFGARIIDDPGGLASAINLGIERGLDDHTFVTWLNDDDLLEPGSLADTVEFLRSRPDAVAAFGHCRYIDDRGRELWVSRAGACAPRILAWGPDLVPQPGMLIRTEAWRAVGGLDPSYSLAFDLDLLLRLKSRGALVSTGRIVSSFRWHPDSLTVDGREINIAESERAKRAALGPMARALAWTWQAPVRVATRVAANEVNRRASRLSAQ